MEFLKLNGLIRRRLLVNFRIQPDIVQRLLPDPFKPKLIKGWAMAGICLIRLEQIRPYWCPAPLGMSSENAAHRIAVCWMDEGNQFQEGVYIPRRDSNSIINHLFGGKLFPGEHQRASFDVRDNGDTIYLRAHALDDLLTIELRGKCTDTLPPTSVFSDLQEASNFFENGSLGYSETAARKSLDAVRLITTRWSVQPFNAEVIKSSYFANPLLFPEGTVEFDCALIMRNIEHSWQVAPKLQISQCARSGI